MSRIIKSRSLFFLIGLVLLIMLLPGVVSAQFSKTDFRTGSTNTPVIGDWNGNGKTEAGVYQNGVWYLDYNGNGVWNAGIDKVYNFGTAGWTPVTGDWNGDGKTKVGVYQNGVWYLDYNGNGVWNAGIDKVYNFGAKGWTSVTGDWNDDGKTEVGVYQNGVWYLDYTGNGAWNASVDKLYSFGATGWTPLPGDWNDDGRTEVGAYQNGMFQLDYNGNGVWNGATGDKQVNSGITGYIPKAGDWNGDGTTEVGLTNGVSWYLDNGGEATPSPSASSITVTASNGGESWARGTAQTITWSYTGSPGSTVKIELLKGGIAVGTIAESVPVGSGGKGTYTWPINPSGTTGSDYKVSVQSTSQSTIKDISNNYFTLIAGTSTSGTTTTSITVTAPLGGETWKRGTSNVVTWSYTGSPGSTVKIELLKGDIPVGTIAASVPTGSGGKGTYTWPIYPSGTTGSDYKVSVQSMSQSTIKDVSNNYFTLIAGTSTSGTTTPSATPTPVIKINNTITTSGSSLYLDQYGIKGDGSDEGPAIQAALNYAAAHSIKTVIFPAGKVITIGSLRIPEGLTLIGNGCTLRLKANAHTDTSPWTWIYVQEGCRVSGFRFDGNRFNGNGMNTNGLMLQGDNTFDNNEVFNVNSYAVFVYGSYPSNIRITNNNIHDIKQYGIDTGGSDGPSSWGYNIIVTGNTISNCGEVGIKIRGTKDSTIANNNIKLGARTGDEPSGIRLYSWDETNTNVKITNNIITGIDQNPSTCINSDDSDNHGISITENKVSHCHDGIDIQFNNGIITGNTISNCVTGLTNSGSGNTISNTILA